MHLRYLVIAAVLAAAGATPASADIPGAYGMWNDYRPSKPAPKPAMSFGNPSPFAGAQGGMTNKKLSGINQVAPPKLEKNTKALVQGGAKPSISGVAPGTVAYNKGSAGSIVVDQSDKKLYYVLGNGRAYAYPVAVGKKGFKWSGTEKVSGVVSWPDWTPPDEMRARKPYLPEHMTGGIRNPLGAKAIYLGSSLYRIHGTNDSKSIGGDVSSGCIRMHNEHVVHLSKLVKQGTKVTVTY
jgi:lipoprotein-anchoring transpeptidase ErfK/SrfK